MNARTPGRRTLFGAAAAIAAAATIPAMTASAAEPDTGQDAELIAACERFLRAEAEYRRRIYADEDEREEPGFARFLVDEYYPAAESVCELPARTAAGIRAKAGALFAFYDPHPPESGSMMSDALWDVLCWVAGKPRAIAAMEPLEGLPPDGHLIDTCILLERAHHDIDAIYAADPEADAGKHPRLVELYASKDVLWRRAIDTKATTRAGQKAKARAALVVAERDLDGRLSVRGLSEDLAYSALADIVGVSVDDPLLPEG